MAKANETAAKNEIKNTAAPIQAAAEFLPEGYDEKEFRKVGDFTPMYKPKNAYEQKYAPILGWLSHCEALPEIKAVNEGDKDRTPLMAHIVIATANKGVNGARTEEVPVDVAPGGSILVPIGGNLLFNKPFMTALFDPKRVWFCRLEVTGTRPSDFPSDTWVWKVELYSKNPKTREGTQFAMVETTISPEVMANLPKKTREQLPATAHDRRVMAQTQNGTMYDPATGQVREGKLIGPATSAS